MQVQYTRRCIECGFATMFDWELRAHLKATGHRRRRYSMPFSRWVIGRWIGASLERRIIASIMLAVYVILLVIFLDKFVPITLVFGLLIGFTLRGNINSSYRELEEDSEGYGGGAGCEQGGSRDAD